MKQPNVTDYIDYRIYLKDLIHLKKQTVRGFSHRKLAASLALASPGYIAEVIKGKKNLSQKLVLKIAQVMELNDRDFRYFEILVRFNQAKWMEEKNHYFSQLSKFKNSRAKVIQENQYKYYTQWYYAAVWTYLGIHPDERNPAKIAKAIYPNISREEAEEAIELLQELKLIQRTANGYEVTNHHIVTKDPFRSQLALQYNQTFLDMARSALESVEPESRQYNVLMFSISKEGFQTIKQRIRYFQEELRDIVDRDKQEDRIYTMCVQLFPNSVSAK